MHAFEFHQKILHIGILLCRNCIFMTLEEILGSMYICTRRHL